MSALHTIHEQQQFFLVAQRAQAQQIFRRSGRDAALALHALNQDGNRCGRNRLARGSQIVERHVPEPRGHRFESFFDLVLAGRRNGGQRAPVKGIRRRQDFKPALGVAEFPRDLEQPFVGLRAAVGKKTFTGANPFDQFGGQPALRLGEIQVRHMNQLAGLLDERLGDGRVRVAEATHGDAAAQVEIALARDVKNITARAVTEHEVKAPVARHDVLTE